MSDTSDDASCDSIPEEDEEDIGMLHRNHRAFEYNHNCNYELDIDDEYSVGWDEDVDEVVGHAIRLLDANEPYTIIFRLFIGEVYRNDDSAGIAMWDENEILLHQSIRP